MYEYRVNMFIRHEHKVTVYYIRVTLISASND